MATGVTVYASTDTSAPTLSGTAGDLITLLDAILVNGYGSKPAAGWTKAFSGTNAASYQMAAGNQFYLDINDNAPGAGGAKEARARGYETMSSVATGTGLFPTVAQMTNGVFIRKSTAASGTTRTWIAVADDRTLYLFIDSGDSLGYTGFMFGDFYSVMTSDAFRTMIIGRSTENDATATPENLSRLSTSTLAATNGHYAARSYTQLGSSVTIGKTSDSPASGGVAFLGGGNFGFPQASDGGFVAAPVFLQQQPGSVAPWRGTMRGFLNGLATGNVGTAFNDRDTLDSVTGRSYIIIGRTFQSTASYYLIETSDTWDTNI